MSEPITDQHVDEYLTQGFTVFRRILPTSLIADLRRVADDAHALAKRLHGPQAQRLQPVGNHPIDQRPFRDYAELPALVDAVRRVLGPQHAHSGGLTCLGILFHPADHPYTTGWHRDWRDGTAVPVESWREHFSDLAFFNQANCPLYDDSCTWVVPGSHLRWQDTSREAALNRETHPAPTYAGSDVNSEHQLFDYCRSMPGAVQLRLGPGDYALYRNTLWHLGCYLPYQRRATLHDGVDTPEFLAWRRSHGWPV